jgi:hypothetical protein
VGASSTDDVWAVGVYDSPSAQVIALIEHWDGTAWSLVSPPPLMAVNELLGVSTLDSADAWAVGVTIREPTTAYRPLALHWDGTAWTAQAAPNPGNANFNAVTQIAATDVWAVGSYFNVALNQAVPLIEHSAGPC